MEDLQPIEPHAGGNMPSKDDLLRKAKESIGASDQSLREAADALADAQDLHGATQAEMARAVGKSEAWVSMLLQWRRSGYTGESPFGPTTKAGRLKHAEDRAASGASKTRKPHKSNAVLQADGADDAQASADRRKAEYAKREAVAEAAGSTGAQRSASSAEHAVKVAQTTADECEPEYESPEANREITVLTVAQNSKGSPTWAKDNLRWAIDHYWSLMDDVGKAEITTYFMKKAGVGVSCAM